MRALLALASVFTLATSAHAECAWVLWLGTGTTYTAFGAYGTSTGEQSCKEAVTQLMADMRREPKQAAEFLRASSRYVCLPDTVDPRGPKGK